MRQLSDVHNPSMRWRDSELVLPEQAWVANLSAFVKQLAPQQLVMLGAWGLFGVSTPALLQENPWDLVVAKLTDTVVFSEDPACNGEDFSAITALPDIDLASMHIYPEYWSICTACALLSPCRSMWRMRP